jgi:glycosyltransferase involved in cell wall biosynthesis
MMSTAADPCGNILFYSSYVSIDGDPAFSRTRSGYGYMVFSIAKAVARLRPGKVRLLTYSGLSEERIHDGVIFCRRSGRGVLREARAGDCIGGIVRGLRSGGGLKEATRIFGAHLSLGETEREMDAASIIHIHGATSVTLPVIRRCIDKDRVPVVTLHGLAAKMPSDLRVPRNVDLENEVLTYWQQNQIVLTVLAPAAAEYVADTFGRSPGAVEVHVVPNGTEPWTAPLNVPRSASQTTMRRGKYRLGLYVGNLSPNKNQYQLVRAFADLEPADRPDIHFILIGDSSRDPRVRRLVDEASLEEHFSILGSISREELSGYYSLADFTILLSHEEGWGLSVIEGFQFGLPAVVMPDMDIVSALSNAEGIHILPGRSNTELIRGLNDFLGAEFDRDAIRDYGTRFDMDEVARKYLACYGQAR